MKRILVMTIAVMVALLLVTSSAVYAGSPEEDDGGAEHQSNERILVKFRSGTSDGKKSEVNRKHGGRSDETISGVGIQVVTVTGNIAQKVKEYESDGDVEYAEPDYMVHVALIPNDPYLGNQWGVTKIQAPEAWDITQSTPQVKIAILDTGIDQNHEDLAAKIVANKNFTNSRTVDDKYGHGTHVAGIAAAITNNGKGVTGVGYNSVLMNVKVLGDNGSGYHSWIARGITWAADNGARVINLSLGSYSYSDTLRSAVDYAWSKGALVVAAAGNDNTSTPLYPAGYSNVLAVGATTQSDTKASFSNYGSWVDVAAPGSSIYSTLPNHSNRIGTKNYGYLSGTSMATPFVSGVAALVIASNPLLSNADVSAKIITSVDATSGFSTPIGRTNAFKAVSP